MVLATSLTRGARSADAPPPLRHGLLLIMLVAFAVTMIGFGWIGYLESDDLFYAEAAWAWAEKGTHLGQSHWSLRHLIVLPTAALFRLFGRSEWALAAPMLAYATALLAMTFFCVRAVAGFTAGLLATALIASAPVIANGASMVYSDLPEAVMVLASLWCFHFAWRQRGSGGSGHALFLLAGVLAGCGFITRETTAVLLAVYGVLFLADYGRNRWAYVWMGAGFVLVVGLDTALLAWTSGDPLHRIHVALRGVAGDNPSMVERIHTVGMFDRHGLIIAPRWLQAPLMMLVNQAIGPMLWLAVPAAILLARRPADTERRRVVRLFGLLALGWFIVLSYGLTSLWLVPRYQIVTVCALAIALGIWLAELAAKKRGALALSLAGGIIALNLLLLAASDRQPRFAERALVDWAGHMGEPIHTDPATLRGAAWLLEVNGLSEQVNAGSPTPGSLFLFNPRPRRALPADWPIRAPDPDWTAVDAATAAPRLTARLSAMLGTVMPAPLAAKLAPPPRSITLYRVPPAACCGDR